MANIFKNRLFQILALSVFLRLFLLGSIPPSLNWDEVSQGYTAFSLSQTGADEWGAKLPIFFRSYGEWKSAVYIYLLIPFIKVLGLSPLTVRLPGALAGVISVYLLYLIGKKLYSEKVGLWSAFLLAVTPWSFMLARPAFEANVALALILAGTYFFLRFKLESKIYLLISSACAFGLAPHTYNSAKLVVPFLVIYLLWSSKLYKNIKSMLFMLAILAVFAYPLLTNLVSGHAQARFTQVGITSDQTTLTKFYGLRQSLGLPDVLQKIIINKPTYFAYYLTNNLLDYLSPGFLIWHGGDRPQHSLPYHGVVYITEYIFVLAGLYYAFSTKKANRFLPLIFIALGIIPAAITRESEHVLRSILAIPGFLLLAGLGLGYLQTHTSKTLFRWLVSMLAVEIVIFMTSYFTWYPRLNARDWQYGYAQVSSYLASHSEQYDQIVVTKWYGEPQLFLAFYNKWDPVWYQNENKNNISYETSGQIWLDQLPEYTVGKYTFKYIEWDKESRGAKTLYIGKFDDFPLNSKFLDTIKFPDGTVAFYILAGDK